MCGYGGSKDFRCLTVIDEPVVVFGAGQNRRQLGVSYIYICAYSAELNDDKL